MFIMPNAVVNMGITYTPPSAPQNSGIATLASTSAYEAQSVGNLDIPTTITPATVMPIPFNSIDVGAQVCVIKNLTAAAIGVRINGAVANNFQLESGASWAYFGPTVPATGALTAVSVEVITAPLTTTEYINYWVMGS